MLNSRLQATALLLPALALAACSGDDDDGNTNPATPDIVALAASTPELSTLASLIQQAGLKSALEAPGPFTVFAPTDAAFDAVPAETIAALQSDPDELARVLQYHVVSGKVDAAQVVTLSEATTLNGETVAIRVMDGNVILTDQRGGESTVTMTDIEASNGIVHLVDAVILPSEAGPGNIVEVATDAGFSTLVQAAVDAGLDGALTGAGPFTVFAPTDAAFAALPAIPSDAGLLANILLHHVVSGELDSTAVVGAGSLTTLAKTTLTVDVAATPITINGFALSETLDVAASNGIVHVVDEVIVPPTILEAAGATDDLSTLVTAVGAASATIQGALAVDGPITVFAPANSAFAAIPQNDLDALLADQAALDDVLGYHVTTGQALSTDLTDGMTITMANGDSATVRIANGEVSIEDGLGNAARVVTADIRLLNGTVHVIDGVLFPPVDGPGSIVDVAVDNGNFGTLVSAATTAGLATTLDEGGPFTVFAPTDAAFTSLGVDLGPTPSAVLQNILLYHAVAGEFDSTAVVGATELMSLANLPLAIDASGNPITIGGAELSSTLDVPADNGIIHVMNEVIVPPTILEVATATPDLSTLVSAVGMSSAGVQSALAPNTLGGDAPLTVFAPTNAAFTAAGIDLMSTPQSTLDAVLSHHVVGSQAVSTDLRDGQVISTLNGDITINVDGEGAITITDGQGNTANVIATLADIRTLTGVVHVIDAVLMP